MCRLMKNLVWEYVALPHALIAGGTGGGKTYFLYILDPKNADLADLGTVSCLDCCWVGIQCWRCERCTVRAVQ